MTGDADALAESGDDSESLRRSKGEGSRQLHKGSQEKAGRGNRGHGTRLVGADGAIAARISKSFRPKSMPRAFVAREAEGRFRSTDIEIPPSAAVFAEAARAQLILMQTASVSNEHGSPRSRLTVPLTRQRR